MPHDSRESEDNFGSNDFSFPGKENVGKILPPVPSWDVYSTIRDMIRAIGDDPDREGLKDTPGRVSKAWRELFAGYDQDPAKIIKTFTEVGDYDEMVIACNIPFTSFCEHHLLPFTGVVHVGYLPVKVVIGLSKIPRLVDVFAKRLQIQERLTSQIAYALMTGLAPRGVGVVLSASHSCVSCRGVNKHSVVMITSSMHGAFKEDHATRNEFLRLVRSGED